MQTEVDAAATAFTSGDSWVAYKILSDTAVRFKGFEMPDSVATDIARLAQEESVRDQIAAWRQFEFARKSASSSSASSQKRAQLKLQKIVDEFPETDAAKEALSLLSGRD